MPETEGEKFWTYWESMGWQRKSGHMKDWEASMRMWKIHWDASRKVNSGAREVRSLEDAKRLVGQ